MPRTTTRTASTGLIALLVLTGCGGSGTATTAATTPATAVTTASATSAPTTPATSAPPTSPGSAPSAAKVTGEFICDVIRKVQADLPAGSPPVAYQAQFTLGVSELLTSGPAVTSEYAANADALARKTCPREYASFLKQSGYANIATL